MTAIGTLTLRRAYFVCPACRAADCPLDARAGLTGYLTAAARRLVCLAGGSWSFDAAAGHLATFCGIAVSDEFIRRTTLQEGAKVAAWQATAPAAAAGFAAAAGDAEFETDAVKVNTVAGWRDAKIGIFACRPRGASADASQWATRVLPKPAARFAFAAIAESDAFAADWAGTARRLGIPVDGPGLTVLGDGAEWIWNRAGEQFPHAAQVLDVFHAIGYVGQAAQALGGGDAGRAEGLLDRGRSLLLSDGYAGVTAWLGEVLATAPAGMDGAAVGAAANYLAGHQERLNYAARLHRGQSIGSGMVEGAAKNMIGRRLKANNARWQPANVNRMAGICAAMYSETWAAYWELN